MSFTKQVTKGLLVAGILLIIISITIAVARIFYPINYFALIIYFFGAWGGSEAGRYPEV